MSLWPTLSQVSGVTRLVGEETSRVIGHNSVAMNPDHVLSCQLWMELFNRVDSPEQQAGRAPGNSDRLYWNGWAGFVPTGLLVGYLACRQHW